MKRAADEAGLPERARSDLELLPVEIQFLIERRLGTATEVGAAYRLATAIQDAVMEHHEALMGRIAAALAAWRTLREPLPDASALGAELAALPAFSLDWYRRNTKSRGIPRDLDILAFDGSIQSRLAWMLERHASLADPLTGLIATLLFMARYTDSMTSAPVRDLLFVAVMRVKGHTDAETTSGFLAEKRHQAEAYELLRFWFTPALIPARWDDDVIMYGPSRAARSVDEIRAAYDKAPPPVASYPFDEMHHHLRKARRVRDIIYSM
jgi:hypothetical protein